MRFRPLLLTLALFLLVPAAAFADGGDIVGTVYLDDQPGSGLCVDVFDNAGNDVASQLTNGAGDYNIYVSQPGSYTVRFGDCGQGYTTTQWYAYATKQEDASAVQVVGDGITPNVNGYLVSAGRVTGHLVDTLNAVVTGACVKAEDLSGYTIGETRTDGNGNYELGGLPPGDVHIRFEGCSAGNYVLQYYDAARSRAAAKPVAVAAGDTVSAIDAVMTPAGRIAGHVQDANGEPIQNACVMAGADGSDVGSAWTDANGNYQILAVPPTGTYELSASGCSNTGYMAAYANGPLVAPPGTTTVDFTLWHPAYITGHVTGDGNLLPSICIDAKNTGTGEETSAETAYNGYYELNWIPPGTYDLTFSDCHATGDWVGATTKGVAVADGQTLFDVDKALAHPEPPVTDPGDSGSGRDQGTADPPVQEQTGAVADSHGSGPVATPPPPRSARACTVPKLVGLSLAKARRTLTRAGCALGKVSRRARRHARKGKVLRQKAKRGASRPAGFRVALTVAR